MASPLVSRIWSTIRSHRRVSWFLLVTLFPIFLPFLILCMPILLLLLAPVSASLFSLLLLYKVKVFLSTKLKGFREHTDTGVGYQACRQIAAAEERHTLEQARREKLEGLEGENVQSMPLEEAKGVKSPNVQTVESHIHDKEEDEVDSWMLPSKVGELEEEELGLPEEHFAVQDGRAEDNITERQLQQGPSADEGRERSRLEGSSDYEEPKVFDVQNVDLPAFLEAHDEEGLQSSERDRDFTEGVLEDTGKELPQQDSLQDNKQEEEESAQDAIQLKDAQKPAGRESYITEGTQEDTWKEVQQEDRMQDEKPEEEEASRELINLRDQQKQPERESDKLQEEEAIEESIFLNDQQKQLERESGSMEGILEHVERELPQEDRVEDDKQEEKEAIQESFYLKDEQKQPEKEHDLIQGTLPHMGKELPHMGRTEDDEKEEEEVIQESIGLKDNETQPERESEITEGTQEDIWKEVQQEGRMQDDKPEEEEASQESISLTDQQKQPERESDKLQEEEAIEESICLNDQQKQLERESGSIEGILEHVGRELPHEDRAEDDKQEEKEAIQESFYLKDEQKQPEREHDLIQGALPHMGKELPHMGRTEDDKKEEEEVIQESIDLKDKETQPERESELTEGTLQRNKELPHLGRTEDDKPEDEETYKEHRQPDRESESTEGTLEDAGKELPGKDRMEEDSKQDEEEAILESIDLKDKQEQPSQHLDAASSHTSEEFRSLKDEHDSLDEPHSGVHQSRVTADWQGPESTKDSSEKEESFHVHQFEEASSRLPSIEAERSAFPEQIAKKPHEELSEQFVIDTPATLEHTREEPELSSSPPTYEHTREEPGLTPATHEHTREELELSPEEDTSPEILDNKERLDMREDIFLPAEASEKKTVTGEPSYRSPESNGQLRQESFAEETKDDEHSQTGDPAQDMATSFDAEPASERKEGHSSEATSSLVQSPHESHEDIEFQDRKREEQKVVADINTIKKIIGYQGEPHASIFEQIRALYLFLGMEPYDWALEVDDLERAQAEIELLKVVVGVK